MVTVGVAKERQCWKPQIRKTRHLAYTVSRQVSRVKSLRWAATSLSPLLWPDIHVCSLVVTVSLVVASLLSSTVPSWAPSAHGLRLAWWECWTEVAIKSKIIMPHCFQALHATQWLQPNCYQHFYFSDWLIQYTVNHELIMPFVHVLQYTEGKAEPSPAVWQSPGSELSTCIHVLLLIVFGYKSRVPSPSTCAWK